MTYEAKDQQERLETYEWDNTWMDHANDREGRARILYVGDSISVGTRRMITARCEEKILCDGFGTSKAVDNEFFAASVRLFAAQLPRCDAMLLNNGLHGWHLSDEEYADGLARLVGELREMYPAVPLFLLLTTHVADEARDERVRRRNAIVREIAAGDGLPVIDLYAVSSENAALLAPDGVHFSKEGYETLAEEICRCVLPVMRG